MMKKISKKLLLSLTVLLLAAILIRMPLEIYADAPYKTYTVDGYGYVTETQTAYLPYMTITKVGEEALNGPTDFTLLEDGSMYILDSGNRRIVVSDLEGNLIDTFGEGTLVNPRGIYVTPEHICYVADRDAKSIFVFDEEGNLTQTYGKPEHALYGSTQDFLPIKIVANSAGTMYVICESNTNGIVQISPVEGGTFLGYFGTNSTDKNLWTIVWRALQTEAQRARSLSNLPSTPTNLAIDEKGLIYTVTAGEERETLKRLNIAGINMIEPNRYDETPAAVAVGNHDNVFVASTQGYIYEYNNEGNMLFVFGGSDVGQQRIGLSTRVEAIQIGTDDKIYVLDSEKAQIQIYEPTEFTSLLHEALFLFSKGRYTESKGPLSQVLQMNNLFDYANMAMGKALVQEEQYEEALHYSRLAKDFDGYSDAFWEIRNQWLKDYLVPVFLIILAILVIKKVLQVLDKKKGILAGPRAAIKNFRDKKLVKELGYMFYFMKHPVDGCYGVKREGRVSLLSTNIILVLGVLFYVINKYFCGFLLKTVREGSYDIVSDVGLLVIAFVLVTGCNYLICTINEGEGKLKDIYCSFVYSFTPYVVLLPVIFLLSHVVTYNEVFFVEFATLFMYVWIVVLVFISIKEINDYSVKDTFKIIGLTLFTILIAVLLAFIIYVLWTQVFEFIQSIAGEVVYRIGR